MKSFNYLKGRDCVFTVSAIENQSDQDATIVNGSFRSAYSMTFPKHALLKNPPLLVAGGPIFQILVLKIGSILWTLSPFKSPCPPALAPYSCLCLYAQEVQGNVISKIFDNLPYMPCQFKIVITKEGLVSLSERCPICVYRDSNFLLPCGHVFCKACVVKWSLPYSSCPLCRTDHVISSLG